MTSPSQTPLRVAIVGVGHMGRFHAEKILSLAAEGEAVVLSALLDHNAARAAEEAACLGARALSKLADVPAHADAAVVAVPTLAHAEVVATLLGAGLDVLVEKPIAATQPEAEALLARAREGGRVLRVGHNEWFNAALQAARPRITRPRFIEAQRLGAVSSRGADVDVVRDLMIHDIHIVQRVLGAEPLRIEASGAPVVTAHLDIASARLMFPGGAVANLSASRVTPEPQRRMRFFQSDAYFSVDLLAGRAWCVTRAEGGTAGEPFTRRALEVEKRDALQSQLRAFLAAVRAREVADAAAEQALAALRTAERITAAIAHAA